MMNFKNIRKENKGQRMRKDNPSLKMFWPLKKKLMTWSMMKVLKVLKILKILKILKEAKTMCMNLN